MNYQGFRGVLILMKKTSLKTFVCSFVFSLFTIFTVDGVYFRNRFVRTEELKISNKNITLFLKNELKSTVSSKVIPVKKIALTLPDKTSSSQILLQEDASLALESKSGKETLFASADQTPQTQKKQSAKEVSLIPLEIDPRLKAKSQKIVEDFDKIINNSPPVDETEIIIAKDETDLNILSSENEKPEFVNKSPADLLPEQAGEIKPFLVAEAKSPNNLISKISASSAQAKQEDFSEPLIPIEKDGVPAKSNGKIEIINSPDQNQLAMAEKNIPIKSMISSSAKEGAGNTEKQGNRWTTMAEKNDIDEPWVVAKGTKHPKNSNVLDQEYYKNGEKENIRKAMGVSSSYSQQDNEIQLADSGMVKNILIPIPEDILNDENLTPQLVSPSSEEKAKLEKEVTENETVPQNQIKVEGKETPATPAPKTSSFLKSITSIFSGSENKNTEQSTKENANVQDDEIEDNFFNRISGRIKKFSSSQKILPTEIRLSFQPNRAEISGQTLKWIQAFANKTLEDSSIGLEIRIDGTSSFALQQKRLNLLHNILTNKGVEYSKINTVFTTREPNSFIIRTVRINNNFNRSKEDNNRSIQQYYQQW